MNFNYIHILCFYIIVIIAFAIIYWISPNTISIASAKFSDCLYFSAVTITTLGYGDIQPITNFGKLLTSIEAISGVIIIGLFFNAAAYSLSVKLEKAQKTIIAEEIKRASTDKIRRSHNFITSKIENYKQQLTEITGIDQKEALNPEFAFCNLKKVYDQARFFKDGLLRPKIEVYSEKLEILCRELRWFHSNHDLSEYEELHNAILAFLQTKDEIIVEKIFNVITFKTEEGIFFHDPIPKITETKCPSIEDNDSNIFTPLIIFYNNLSSQIQNIKKIEDELDKIIKITIMENKTIQLIK